MKVLIVKRKGSEQQMNFLLKSDLEEYQVSELAMRVAAHLLDMEVKIEDRSGAF